MSFSADQIEIQALARGFAEGELRPHTARWDAERALDEDIFDKLAELGFLGMRIPEEHGGLGFDLSTYLLVLEELSWGDASVGFAVAIHNGPMTHLILAHGSEAQRADYLPRMATGELMTAFGLSEPGVGSDAAALETRAVETDGGWVLDGSKRWVTGGMRAGVIAVFARTGDGEDAWVTAFLVDSEAEGLTVGGRETTMGLRASDIVSIELASVAIPETALLGEPGDGLRYAFGALDVGRLGIAAQAIGVARAALEHAVAYSLERHQFDRPIADFGAIQEKLASMSTQIEAARALLHQTAGAWDGEAPPSREERSAGAARAKLFASETAAFVTDEAVQIFGGYGYMRDYPVEKLMRDAKGAEIYEGTSEIMRRVVARQLLARARVR
jgi:alkylation response protein AidB-like acyl-CoA dehydrogenase